MLTGDNLEQLKRARNSWADRTVAHLKQSAAAAAAQHKHYRANGAYGPNAIDIGPLLDAKIKEISAILDKHKAPLG